MKYVALALLLLFLLGALRAAPCAGYARRISAIPLAGWLLVVVAVSSILSLFTEAMLLLSAELAAQSQGYYRL